MLPLATGNKDLAAIQGQSSRIPAKFVWVVEVDTFTISVALVLNFLVNSRNGFLLTRLEGKVAGQADLGFELRWLNLGQGLQPVLPLT